MANAICGDYSNAECIVPFVSRDEWLAAPPKITIEQQRYEAVDGKGGALRDALRRIIIHHTSGSPFDSAQDLQHYAFEHRFDDTPYHFYISGDGTIFESRDLRYIGAHAGLSLEAEQMKDIRLDPDYGSIGIAVAGCFDASCGEQEEPTEVQKIALFSLILSLRGIFPYIGPDDIMGHSDVRERVILKSGLTPGKSYTTACPGTLKGFVDQIAALLRNAGSGGNVSAEAVRPFVVDDRLEKVSFFGARFYPADVDVDLLVSPGDTESTTEISQPSSGITINGGYFGSAGKPKGLLIRRGERLAMAEEEGPYSGLFAVGRDGGWDLKYLRNAEGKIVMPTNTKDFQFALQAGPMIIEPGGKDGIPSPKPGSEKILMRRTVIAKAKSGEWYFITTAPMSLFDLQQTLRAFIPDIDAAMNLDGGPSTAFSSASLGTLLKPGTPLPVFVNVAPKHAKTKSQKTGQKN